MTTSIRVPFLDLSRQVAALREELDEAVGAVLEGLARPVAHYREHPRYRDDGAQP